MQTAEDIDQSLPKHPGGRPSKYSPAILEKTKQYLETYKDLGDPVPTIAGLAQELDITRETIHQWKQDKNKAKFSYMIKQFQSIQERALVAGGLSSKLNPSVTKLMMTKHGYTDNPQGNQGPAGITVQVNRGSVKLKSGGQELEIDTTEDTGRTIEHKP